MSEEFIIEKGRTLNTSFSDYKMPRSLDAPRVKSSLVETVDPLGPFGAKEASEVVLVSTYPAIVNAIHNATGVWIKELPTTSEKVLKALKEKGA